MTWDDKSWHNPTPYHSVMTPMSPLYSWFIYFGKSFYINGWRHPCKDWMVLPPFSYVIWIPKCQLEVGDLLFHKDNQNVNWSDDSSLDLLLQKAKWKCQLRIATTLVCLPMGSLVVSMLLFLICTKAWKERVLLATLGIVVCEEVSTHTLGDGDGLSKPPPTSCGMKALI